MFSRPNLIYVFADQLRYQALGYAGDERAITPNIDRFATQCVDFYNAVSTYPVCAPYRASLFTGKYPTSTGMVINELRMNPNQRCLGHMLTEADYQTSYIGKWHLYANEFGNHDDPKNSFVPRGPHRLGFDGEWSAYGFRHEYYNSYYFTETPEKIFYGEGVYETDGQTDLAIDFINRAAQSDQPFALILSWGPPHAPWTPDNVPPQFLAMFEDVSFSKPPNYRAENDDPYADGWAKQSQADRDNLEEWLRVYYAQTTSVDWNFGRLLQAVDEAGVADNTIVVFTSDHGEMLGAQGRMAKSIFYEEACRVPMLIRWPDQIRAGSRSDVCISTVDILPTLAGLMGLESAPDVEGMDLSHVALGEVGPEPEAAFLQGTGAVAVWEDGFEWRALRDKRFTYANYRVDGKELLFDHTLDPFQLNNLADDPAYSVQLGRYRAQLKEKLASLNDTFEASTWYRDHWIDENRNIMQSATGSFSDYGGSLNASVK